MVNRRCVGPKTPVLSGILLLSLISSGVMLSADDAHARGATRINIADAWSEWRTRRAEVRALPSSTSDRTTSDSDHIPEALRARITGVDPQRARRANAVLDKYTRNMTAPGSDVLPQLFGQPELVTYIEARLGGVASGSSTHSNMIFVGPEGSGADYPIEAFAQMVRGTSPSAYNVYEIDAVLLLNDITQNIQVKARIDMIAEAIQIRNRTAMYMLAHGQTLSDGTPPRVNVLVIKNADRLLSKDGSESRGYVREAIAQLLRTEAVPILMSTSPAGYAAMENADPQLAQYSERKVVNEPHPDSVDFVSRVRYLVYQQQLALQARGHTIEVDDLSVSRAIQIAKNLGGTETVLTRTIRILSAAMNDVAANYSRRVQRKQDGTIKPVWEPSRLTGLMNTLERLRVERDRMMHQEQRFGRTSRRTIELNRIIQEIDIAQGQLTAFRQALDTQSKFAEKLAELHERLEEFQAEGNRGSMQEVQGRIARLWGQRSQIVVERPVRPRRVDGRETLQSEHVSIVQILNELRLHYLADGTPVVTPDIVAAVAAAGAGKSAQEISQSAIENALRLRQELSEIIIGQPEMVDYLVLAAQTRIGIVGAGNKPFVGLVRGPTGVGKSFGIEQLARVMGWPIKKVQMNGFSEPHSVSRLLGSAPGYVGYDAANDFVDFMADNPEGIVVLDEIEKAHRQVLEALMELLDTGEFQTARGKTVKFRGIIWMTSNLGDVEFTEAAIARELAARDVAEAVTAEKAGNLELASTKRASAQSNIERAERFEAVTRQKGREKWGDAVLNRMDVDVYANRMTPEAAATIVKLEIRKRIEERLRDVGVKFRISPGALEMLATTAFDPVFGGRALKRFLQRTVETVINNIYFAIRREEIERKYPEHSLFEDATFEVEQPDPSNPRKIRVALRGSANCEQAFMPRGENGEDPVFGESEFELPTPQQVQQQHEIDEAASRAGQEALATQGPTPQTQTGGAGNPPPAP